MKTDGCRDWRHLLGAYALGDLGAEERAGLEAHLEGCAECRAEAESLESVARLLPLADPERFSRPAPLPSPDLGREIAATIGRERRVGRAAAALALRLRPGRDRGSRGGVTGDLRPPRRRQRLAGAARRVRLAAGGSQDRGHARAHAYGTEIRMYVKGVRSGTLCHVYLRGPHGERCPPAPSPTAGATTRPRR